MLFVYICIIGYPIIRGVWDSINMFNPTTLLCLFQARIWISNVICHGLFHVQWLFVLLISDELLPVTVSSFFSLYINCRYHDYLFSISIICRYHDYLFSISIICQYHDYLFSISIICRYHDYLFSISIICNVWYSNLSR